MKRFLKVMSLAIVLVMVFSYSAFAATPTIQLDTPTVDKEEKTAVVSGSITEPLADSQATIIVVDSSVTSLSNLSDSDIAYVDQVDVQENGTFTFPLAINQDNFSGDEFTAYVGGTGVTTVASTPIKFATSKPGDATGDGYVDIDDYDIVINNFNKAEFNPQADVTGDGYVDIDDYDMVINNYNT